MPPKMIALLRKKPVGDIQRDGFAGAAEFSGFSCEFSRFRAHLFEQLLKRGERSRYIAAIWKMHGTPTMTLRVTPSAPANVIARSPL